MSPAPDPVRDRQVRQVRALAARYLDPRARWTLDDDDAARALREAPEPRAAWALAVATHRALVGAADGLPSGLEQRRQAELAMVRAGVASASPSAARTAWRSWLRFGVPLLAVGGVALFVGIKNTMSTPDEWIRARGLSRLEMPEPRVGLGVGAVSGDGIEYEAIGSGQAHIDDWLRFSYTNERPELAWLHVFALQSAATGSGLVLHPLAPLPEEGQSLPVRVGRFVQLPFETRLAARHHEGPVRLVALFLAAPIRVEALRNAITDLDSATMTALPSELEALLRDRLPLSRGDVVQILDTRIVPGSAAPPPSPGPRQETP